MIIRVLHLASALKLDLLPLPRLDHFEAELLLRRVVMYEMVMRNLVRPIFRAAEVLRQPGELTREELTRELRVILASAIEMGNSVSPESIWMIVDRKLAKNRARGYKHGGKAF